MKSTMVIVLAAAGLSLIGACGSALAQQPLGQNHYQCYQVLKPDFKVPPAVNLKDQFGPREKVVLRQAVWLCAPTSKNGERVPDAETHLLCYPDPWQRPTGPRVRVTNQFGTGTLIVGQPSFLCVPTKKEVLK